MKVSRIAAAGALAASAVLVLSAPAFAHVTVQPEGTAAKGGYATVNFKVPNERDNASTTKLEVNFPTDHPLASVHAAAVAGWKIEVTKSKLDKPLEMHGKKINEAVIQGHLDRRRQGHRARLLPEVPGLRRPAPRGRRRAGLQGPPDVLQQGGRALDRGAAGRARRSPRTRRRCWPCPPPTDDHHGASAANDDVTDDAEEASAETRPPPSPPTAPTPPPASWASWASSSVPRAWPSASGRSSAYDA